MKVAQEIDVDNVTIIINPQNKLQAVGSSLEFEEIRLEYDDNSPISAIGGSYELEGSHRYHERRINLTKLFKLKGTDFYLFGGELEEIVRPLPPDPIVRVRNSSTGTWYSMEGDGSRLINFTNYSDELGDEDHISGNLSEFKHLFPESGFKFSITLKTDSSKRKVFHIRLINDEYKLFDITDSEEGIEVIDKVELFNYFETASWTNPGPGGPETDEHYNVTTDTLLTLIIYNINGFWFRIEDAEGRHTPPRLNPNSIWQTGNFYTTYVDIEEIRD